MVALKRNEPHLEDIIGVYVLAARFQSSGDSALEGYVMVIAGKLPP